MVRAKKTYKITDIFNECTNVQNPRGKILYSHCYSILRGVDAHQTDSISAVQLLNKNSDRQGSTHYNNKAKERNVLDKLIYKIHHFIFYANVSKKKKLN